MSITTDVKETMKALGVDEQTALKLELIYRQTLAHLAGNETAEIGFSAAVSHAAGLTDADTMRQVWDQIGFGVKEEAAASPR